MSEKIYLRTYITPTYFCDFDLTHDNHGNFEGLQIFLMIGNSTLFVDSFFKLTKIAIQKINNKTYHFYALNCGFTHNYSRSIKITVVNKTAHIKTYIYDTFETSMYELHLTRDDLLNKSLNGKVVCLCLKDKQKKTYTYHAMSNNFECEFDTCDELLSMYCVKIKPILDIIENDKNNDIDSYHRYEQSTPFSLCLNDIIMMKRNTKELNYTDKCDECCVCYKETFRKTTKCHHTLCVDCFKQLKKNDGELNCPYCRAVLC